MKIDSTGLHYVTDQKGTRVAVIIPIEQYNELLEDLQDLMVAAKRRDEPTIPHDEVVKKIQRIKQKTEHNCNQNGEIR